MNFRKLMLTAVMTAMIVLSVPSTDVQAHDTDIYLNSSAALGGEPLVMFVLDYRSNLGSTVCGGGECQFLIDEGYLDASTNPITFFDMMRAVFKKVLDPLGGFKIGFMLNHENNNNCGGPQSNKKCSNGAYVIQGFTSMSSGDDNPELHGSALDIDTTGTCTGSLTSPCYKGYDLGEDPNKKALYQKLDNMPVPGGNLAHPFQGKELYFELFRYLTGQGVYNMKNGYNDFGTNNDGLNINDVADLGDGNPAEALLSWDGSALQNPNSYKSPLDTASDCASIYVINLMFQVSQQEADSDSAITAAHASGGMATPDGTAIDISGNKNSFDTVIKWMHDVDLAPDPAGSWPGPLGGKQNVVSYFVVDPSKINNTTIGYAEAGGTTRPLELSSDPRKLIAELQGALRSILSTSTTFVAPSVAVNVYNRAQALNDVFIAMFQAEENGFPTWVGNVKKFQIGTQTFIDPVTGLPTTIQAVLDSNGIDAVDHTDGRIRAEALSYWTDPTGLVDPTPTDEYLAGADGRFVDRGGCGSRIPGYKLSCSGTTCTSVENPGIANTDTSGSANPRQLFYDPTTDNVPAGTPIALEKLNADTTEAGKLQTDLGAATVGTCGNSVTADYSACGLIRFARGLRDDGTNRNWMMGDSLHSRPLAINYGARGSFTEQNPDIRVFAGSNDGFMRMVRNTTSGGAQDGVEGWGFMPRRVMKQLYTLKYNSATSAHPHLADGSPVAYVLDANSDGAITVGDGSGDQAILYFGLRRGGNAYYALDITDPDNPKFLWRIEGPEWKWTGAGFGWDVLNMAHQEFSELGQTWSAPRIGRMITDGGTTPRTVLIFAGGYDENKDTHGTGVSPDHSPRPGGDDTIGRAIYVVDALTGDFVWKGTHTDMVDSIPSDVTIVDSDSNGLIDRMYVGDTGGRVWRVDAFDPDANNWTVTPILSVGRHASAAPEDDRRFFYAPDYVQSKDINGDKYDAIILGSGDRTNPLDKTIKNYYYMIKETGASLQSGSPPSTVLASSDLGDVSACANGCVTPPDLTNGWQMALSCPWQASTVECGEKALSTAVTIAGEIFMTTYQPPVAGVSSSSCEPNEGTGWLYRIRLEDARAVEDFDVTKAGNERYRKLNSPGIASEVITLDGSRGMTSDLEFVETNSDVGYKTYWYQK